MTAPWAPEVADLLGRPHQLAVEVEATDVTGFIDDTIPVAVDGCRLSWSETSAPRCRAFLDGPVPDTLADLHFLDPRRPIRMRIRGGYRLDTGELDMHDVATLDLRLRDVTRTGGANPTNRMHLEAAGVEVRLIDNGLPMIASVPPDQTKSLTAAIGEAVASSTFYGYDGVVPLVVDPLLPDVEELGWDTTQDTGTPWDQVDDWADSLDADLFDEGDGILRLGRRPTLAGSSVLQLRTGPGGIVTSSTSRLSREGWNNAAFVAYELPGTEPGSGSYGTAQLPDTSPYAPLYAGFVTAVERRPRRRSTATANWAAAAILARQQSRGRSYIVESPVALWVRPGDTITVQLVTGAQERHLVTDVDMDLFTGRMTLSTRLPDGAQPTGE